MLESWDHARKLGHFTRGIAPNDDMSVNFSRPQSPLDEFGTTFLRSSLNFPCLIAVEQYAYCSECQLYFWSLLGQERPENLQIFHRNPFRGRIESIKSASKRSPKVTLKTCPRLLLEILISCRICISKYSRYAVAFFVLFIKSTHLAFQYIQDGSVQFSFIFIGARTLKMPVPYPPPSLGAYTRTPSHQPLVFGRKGTDHLPEVG